MPGIQKVKSLYKATSMQELNDKVNTDCNFTTYKGSEQVYKLCKAGDKLFKLAQKSFKDGDEEMAYVCYMRYCNLAQYVMKTPHYKKNKVWEEFIGMKNLRSAVTNAENLSESLTRRYEALKESCNCAENCEKLTEAIPTKESAPKEDISKKSAPEEEKSITVTNKDKIEVANIPRPTNITSQKLYDLMDDKSVSLLIFDVRSSEDYVNSHISFEKSINIPDECLSPGITSAKLSRMIQKSSLELWSKRGHMDFIVLLDWNSREAQLTDTSPLLCLRSAIYKWDSQITLKSQPLILEGGFQDWVLHFPMLVTNPDISLALSTDISGGPLKNGLPDIAYPDFDKLLSPEKPPPPPPTEKTNLPTPITSYDTSSIIDSTSSTLTKPRSSTPKVDRRKKPPNLAGSGRPEFPSAKQVASLPSLPTVKPADTPIKKVEDTESTKVFEQVTLPPTVDRSSKPTSRIPVKTSRRPSSSSLVVENVEDEDLDTLSSPSVERKLDKESEKAEETVEKPKAQAIVKEPSKEVPSAENERKIPDTGKHSEPSEAESAAGDEIRAFSHSKRLLDRDAASDLDTSGSSSSSETTGPVVKSARNLVNKSMIVPPKIYNKGNGDGEYVVPLRDRSRSLDTTKKSGLTRSHSSPNIAKMVEEEEDQRAHKTGYVPHFDRSLKPNMAENSRTGHKAFNQMSFGLDGGKPIQPRNFAPIYGNQGYGVTGLKNLGNTCFMNSIVQCLAATTPMALYFVHGDYVRSINRNSKFGTKGQLAEELAHLVRAMWMGQYRSITPKDFKDVVGYHMPMFVGNDQHDAHEFLVMLLEKLHADLNSRGHPGPIPSIKLPENIPQDEAVDLFWVNHKQFNDSIISRLFEGLLCSTLTCQICGEVSNTYEVFRCLSLPIPSTMRPNLDQCVQEFSKPEMISGDCGWDCPKCKQKRRAEKKIRVCRYPEILVLQLKRFSYDGMWRKKIQTYVDFPISQFRMSSGQLTRTYSLYAVSNHYGTLEGGHYIAYCDNSPKRRWYKYDDNEVTELSEREVKTQAAYILFYTSKDFQDDLRYA